MKSPNLKCILSLLFSVCITGCVDLSGTRLSSGNKSNNHLDQATSVKSTSKKYTPKDGEIYTMRGGLGIFSIGMNQLRDAVADRYNIPSSSTMWYNAGNVSQAIKDYRNKTGTPRPVILVGHSLGANEQIKVARELNKAGIPVDLLVTVDAVSQTIIPPNVKHALNLYKPGYVPMFSGLKLRAVDPNATLIENINVDTLKGVQVNHFTIDKDDLVQNKILVEVEKVLSDANRKHARG